MLLQTDFLGSIFTVGPFNVNGGPDANGVECILIKEDGWTGTPAIKAIRADRPARPGVFRGVEYRGARVVVLEFRMFAPSIMALQNALDQLDGVFPDPKLTYPLTVQAVNGTKYINVALDGALTVTPIAAQIADCSVQLFAPDLRKFSTTPRYASTGLATAGNPGIVYPMSYPVAPNLAPNYSFESGTTGWVAVGAGLLANTAGSWTEGAQGARVTSTQNTSVTGLQTSAQIVTGVNPLDTYLFTADVSSSPVTGNVTTTLSVDWFNGATLLSTTTTQQLVIAGNTFTNVGGMHTAPANANAAVLRMDFGKLTAGLLVVFDNIQFRDQTGKGVNYGTPGSAGTVSLYNAGTADSDVAYTLTGTQLTNPSLTRLDTGDTLTYNGTLITGQTLVINTGTGTCTLNGVNRRPLLTTQNWFSAAAGSTTTVAFRTQTTGDSGNVTATWTDTYY